jgi:hypothetical protein
LSIVGVMFLLVSWKWKVGVGGLIEVGFWCWRPIKRVSELWWKGFVEWWWFRVRFKEWFSQWSHDSRLSRRFWILNLEWIKEPYRWLLVLSSWLDYLNAGSLTRWFTRGISWGIFLNIQLESAKSSQWKTLCPCISISY